VLLPWLRNPDTDGVTSTLFWAAKTRTVAGSPHCQNQDQGADRREDLVNNLKAPALTIERSTFQLLYSKVDSIELIAPHIFNHEID
jgi:hypothetical protein